MESKDFICQSLIWPNTEHFQTNRLIQPYHPATASSVLITKKTELTGKKTKCSVLFSIHIYLLISTTSFINLQLFFVVLEERYIHEKFWRRIFGFSKISVNYFGQNPEVVYYFSQIEAENENKRYV